MASAHAANGISRHRPATANAVQILTTSRSRSDSLRSASNPASVSPSCPSRRPRAAAWRPGLALIYSDLRLDGECRETFEYLAADNFTRLPKDALWLTCIAYLAEVCAFLEDTDRAATLYRLLLPYDGRVVVVGSAVACYGAVSRFLGLLATTMCLWEQAERHFEEAVELNIHLEAWPWLAHTQHQYASMLLARGGDGDHSRAVTLLEKALTIAEDLDMQFLIRKAQALSAEAFRHS